MTGGGGGGIPYITWVPKLFHHTPGCTAYTCPSANPKARKSKFLSPKSVIPKPQTLNP